MAAVTLAQASALVDAALAHGGQFGLAPLTVAVLDPLTPRMLLDPSGCHRRP